MMQIPTEWDADLIRDWVAHPLFCIYETKTLLGNTQHAKGMMMRPYRHLPVEKRPQLNPRTYDQPISFYTACIKEYERITYEKPQTP